MIPKAFSKFQKSFNPSYINIIAFGPGVGESILLFLPGLGWGIIDSCTVRIKKKTYNPALECLKALNVKRLSFVILTHPHLDHYDGFEMVIEYYLGSIDRICLYSGEGLREYAAYLARKKIVGERGFKSLSFILDKIKQAKERGANVIKISERTEIIRKKQFGSHKIEMIALSPSEDSISRYCETLFQCIPKEKSDVIKAIKRSDQNLVSSAIWCKINNQVLIFGGDLENGVSLFSGWNGVLRNLDSPELAASFFKVPHHGSPTSYSENLWTTISPDKTTTSIVTPYNPSKLPDSDILKKIKNHSNDVLITSKAKFEKPEKLYKKVPLKSSIGIKSWDYIKLPQQIGFVHLLLSCQDGSDKQVYLSKPAYIHS